MTDERLEEWLKVVANEQRRQTKALEDTRLMVLIITVVVGISGILSVVSGLLAIGVMR